MGLQVVGVGLGRTGTNSLKLALEQLLGGRCHHMHEILERTELMGLWTAALAGHPDWDAIFDGDVATVDWPAAAFWRELVVEYPDAVVLLSERANAKEWWQSAHDTIFDTFAIEGMPPEIAAWLSTVRAVIESHGIDLDDEAVSEAAYERHLADVRATVAPSRLVEWTTGDGWGPLCEALGVAVPEEPFPHLNTTQEFRGRVGLGAAHPSGDG
jgi:hypothetical protein